MVAVVTAAVVVAVVTAAVVEAAATVAAVVEAVAVVAVAVAVAAVAEAAARIVRADATGSPILNTTARTSTPCWWARAVFSFRLLSSVAVPPGSRFLSTDFYLA